jgi:hypothetical protein
MDNVIKRASDNHDFIIMPNGLYHFWPTKNTGPYSEFELRSLANELERRNNLIKQIKQGNITCNHA